MVLKNVRLSYAHIWEPKESFGTSQYSTGILIPKDHPQIGVINEELARLKEEFKAAHKGKLPGKFKSPLRDGDIERPQDPNYMNHYFINAYAKKRAPEIVDMYKNKITNPSEVYSGCYVNISVTFYTFDTATKGIACGLNNIQKLRDGSKLGGATTAAEDFEVEEGDTLLD
jgi:hypothetical protein